MTGVGVVNDLGSVPDDFAASLRARVATDPVESRVNAEHPDRLPDRGRTGSDHHEGNRVASEDLAGDRPVGDRPPAREGAGLLGVAARSIQRALEEARRRWGASRVAVVLGCVDDVDAGLEEAVTICQARGPAYAVTTGDRASAQAIVSALNLLRANFADAVAIATRTRSAAAWTLIERQRDSDVEISRAEEADLTALADAQLNDLPGLPDLGPAHALTCVVAATLALQHGDLLQDRVACLSRGVTVLLEAKPT